MTLTEEQEHIIRHSLGLGQSDTPYRSYYCSDANEHLLDAVERGLLTGPHSADWLVAPYWYVTEAGANAVGHTLEGMR